MYFLAMTSFLHNKLSHINEMLSSLIQPKQINQTGAFKMDNIFKDEKNVYRYSSLARMAVAA